MPELAPSTSPAWEALDRDLDQHTVAASEAEAQAIDDALGLQHFSIRFHRNLIAKLKFITEFHGVGYQPLVRDLLDRFARSEIENIAIQLEAREADLVMLQESTDEPEPKMEVIDGFLARESARRSI